MGAILGVITKVLPFLGPLLERILPGDSAKAAELRAQRELIEARAFAKGRISPKYLIYYAIAFFFIAYGVVVLIAVFVPGLVTGADDVLRHLKTMIGLGQDAFGDGA